MSKRKIAGLECRYIANRASNGNLVIINYINHFWVALRNYFLPPVVQLPPQSEIHVVLAQSRERLVTGILRFTAWVGLFATLAGTPEFWMQGIIAPLVVAYAALATFFWLSFQRHISYEWRAIALIGFAYAFVISSYSQTVDLSLHMVLLAFVVVTTVLLGTKATLPTIVIVALTLVWLNWRWATGNVVIFAPFVAVQDGWVLLIAYYTSWFFYVGTVAIPVMIILNDLNVAWQRERKATLELERERDRLAYALEREQLLAAKLKKSLDVQADTNRLKTVIIESVSHEFRTPLTIIQSAADMMFQYYDRLSPEKRQSYYYRVGEQIRYLTKLIEDVLTINTEERVFESINLEFQPVQIVCQSLEAAARNFNSEDTEVIVTTKCDDSEAEIGVDMALLQLVVSNLISNAVKYGGSDPQIRFDVQLADSHLNISVSDNGIGILSDEIDQIFELFYRGQNTDAKRGLGLGLYIVQQAVSALSGQIAVKSDGANTGATFSVMIPVRNQTSKRHQSVTVTPPYETYG